MGISEWGPGLKRYVKECRRVLKVTKKPSQTEFRTIVKVSGAGMFIIGTLGFLVQMVKTIFT